jgi:hypothetical protein
MENKGKKRKKEKKKEKTRKTCVNIVYFFRGHFVPL